MTDRFISVDWGTSNLRVRLARRPNGEILGQIATDDGVAKLASENPAEQRPAAFRKTLLHAIELLSARCESDLGALRVVISGMASSTLGWHELEYARLPLALDGGGLTCHELPPLLPPEGSPAVLLLSGARSDNDVMRGEETEALGLHQCLADDPGLGDDEPAVWIFPGTHSKHLRIERGNLVGFSTFMTGELFDLLCTHSVLRHAVRPPAADELSTRPQTNDDFQAGLDEARSMPLTNALFHVRTRSVLKGTSGPANAAFLSGLLIGAEMSAIQRNSLQIGRVVLCAGEKMAEPYRQALVRFDLAARSIVVPPDVVATLSVRGQCVALQHYGRNVNQ